MDRISPEARSRNMSRIRGKDTAPEMIVRRLLHRLGYRFRLHAAALPGRPDIVFPGRSCALFVHGCFWHRHTGCRYARMPTTRTGFWSDKFEANVKRDTAAVEALEHSGWRVLTVWECETRQLPESLAAKLQTFLGPPGRPVAC